MIKSAFKFGLIGLVGTALMGCSDGAAQDGGKSVDGAPQSELTGYVPKIINETLLSCQNTECKFKLVTEVNDGQSLGLAYRNNPRLSVSPILKAIEIVGPTRFEELHGVSSNALFMFDKDVINGLTEFETVWLYNPRALSQTGPKPNLELLPYYYRLRDKDGSQFFVGNYDHTKGKGFALDFQTKDAKGRLIRITSGGDEAAYDNLSAVSQNCDAICQILGAGLDDARKL